MRAWLHLFLLLSTLAQGQEPLRLTLRDALARAETANLQVRAGQWDIPVARAGLTLAGVRPNPVLSLDGPIGPAETKSGITFEQPFELGGKRAARLGLAEAQLSRAENTQRELTWKTRGSIRTAYLEWLLAQANREQQQATIDLFQSLLQVSDKRWQAGDVAEADVIRARFELATARRALLPVESRIQQGAIQLAVLLGLPAESPLAAQDTLETLPRPELPSLESLQDQAVRLRPDLAGARQDLAVSQAQLELSRTAQTPDLSAISSFLYDHSNGEVGLVLGLKIELFTFNDHSGEVEQATAQLEKSRALFEALEVQARGEVATAYRRYQAARLQVERDQAELLPGADQVLRLAEKSYQYGQSDLTQLLVAQQAAVDTRQLYRNDLSEAQQALGTLEQAIGGPLP